ncbi:MAG: helix-turn-helix transcriptional regulator [Solidesulfovibrio sp.]|uniref:helix-turn-helix domain-containing protein n=1 Tax=Solidesulfovibrio sp. TaxID=2910990 RepID=UPI0031596222
MNFCEPVHTITPTRQDRCRAWLVERRIVFKDLAADAGMSKTTLSNIIAGRRATPQHIQKLIALGVPAELLPEPRMPAKPGPKRRARSGAPTRNA